MFAKEGISMETELRPHLKIRLFREEKCFGPGVAELMRRVERLHSLRAAARSMDMAYSKAWTTVRSCEAALGFQLLDYSAGGRNGGGAVLTAEGKDILERYTAYCEAVNREAGRLFSEYFE